MNFHFTLKVLLKIFLLLFILFYSACTSKTHTQETTEDYSTVKIHEEEAQNPQKRNKNKLEHLLIKKADSFYFVNNFKQAQTLYDMALNNVTDAETKKYLLQKIADTKVKIQTKKLEDSIKIKSEK